MKYIKLGNELEQASQLVLGCMRMAQKTSEEIVDILTTAQEVGISAEIGRASCRERV